MNRWSAARVAGVALALLVIVPAPAAGAAGWCVPVDDGTVLLGFGVAHAGGTHRGVDLAGEVGAEVVAPADGTVTFAGSVPADGGGTCGAVTLELADGRRVSLLPLDGVTAVAGNSVRAGDALGAVASCGDDSTDIAHVHLGLRRGDLYLDPGPLLTSVAATNTEPDISSVAVPSGAVSSASGRPVGVVTPAASAAQSPVVASVPKAGSSTAAVTSASVADVSAAASPCPRAARRLLRSAGVPERSSVVVHRAGELSRGRTHVGLPATRATAGWLLAIGMCAVGASIAVARRASPVRVR